MSVPDNSKFNEMKELLQQMKELHAPDRCEGFRNYVWHGIQQIANIKSGEKTSQQKITDHWNEEKDIKDHKNDLKKLASKAQQEFWMVCCEVNKSKILSITSPHREVWDTLSNLTKEENDTKNADLAKFIDDSGVPQVQKMFDIMIVQSDWRNYMMAAWITSQ
jgi:hypothetical protein